MNTVIMISDNAVATVSHESGSRGKAAPEPRGDGAEQRFADVLPLAEAALKPPSEKTPPKETPKGGQSVDERAGEDPPVRTDRPASQKGETLPGSPQIVGWAFVEAVPPAIRRAARADPDVLQPAKPATRGQRAEPAPEGQAKEAVVPGPAAGKQASRPMSLPEQVSHTGSGPVQARHAQQPSANEGFVGTSVKMATAAVATAANAAAPAKQQNAVPATGVDKQTTPGPQRSQEAASAGTVQIIRPVLTGAGGPSTDSQSGRVRNSPDSEVVKATPPSGKQEVPETLRSVSGGQADGAEKPSQTPAKPQPVNSQAAAVGTETSPKPEKSSQWPAREGQESPPSRHSAASGERPKVELEQAASSNKEIPATGAKDAAAVTPNPSVSTTGESVVLPQRPAAPMPIQPQAGGDPAATRAPTQSIGEQILDSLQVTAPRGDRQVLIRLNPPELGTVLVRFQEQGELLSGTLEVGSREARREIEQALPQVIRSLQEAGVQVRRLEVVPSDQPERDLSREHQPQDAWSHHQGSGQGREHSHASPQTRWPQGTGSHGPAHPGASSDELRAAAAEGGLDLLL